MVESPTESAWGSTDQVSSLAAQLARSVRGFVRGAEPHSGATLGELFEALIRAPLARRLKRQQG